MSIIIFSKSFYRNKQKQRKVKSLLLTQAERQPGCIQVQTQLLSNVEMCILTDIQVNLPATRLAAARWEKIIKNENKISRLF